MSLCSSSRHSAARRTLRPTVTYFTPEPACYAMPQPWRSPCRVPTPHPVSVCSYEMWRGVGVVSFSHSFTVGWRGTRNDFLAGERGMFSPPWLIMIYARQGLLTSERHSHVILYANTLAYRLAYDQSFLTWRLLLLLSFLLWSRRLLQFVVAVAKSENAEILKAKVCSVALVC